MLTIKENFLILLVYGCSRSCFIADAFSYSQQAIWRGNDISHATSFFKNSSCLKPNLNWKIETICKKRNLLESRLASSNDNTIASTNGIINIDDETIDDLIEQKRSMLDDFRPKTSTLLQSLIFFSRYVIKTINLNRKKKKQFIKKRHNNEDEHAYKENVPTFRETLANLNTARKQIVHLVGYTSALIAPSFAFLILGSLFTSIVPHYYSNSITALASFTTSTATTSVQTEKLFKNLIGLGIFSTLMALTTGIRGSLFWIAGSRANYNVRTKFHRNLLRQEAAFFDGTETGILISRLNNDVNKIGNVVSFHVNIILRQVFQFIFGSVYLLQISPSLSAFAFAGISIIAYLSKLYGDFARDLAEEVQNLLAEGSAVAETSFAMSETVRAFNGLDLETDRYESAQYNALELEEVQAWAYGTHKFVSDTLQAGMQIILLIACWTLAQRGKLAASKLTTFLFYVNFVLESSNEVGDQWAKIQTALGASSSVFNLIRRVPKIMDPLPNPSKNADELLNTNGHETNLLQDGYVSTERLKKPIIEMKDMTITYDEMDSISPALQNINLQVFPNDKIAIVGRSGSGKSSMLRTLLRFYDPSSGRCYVDGKPLTEYRRKEIVNKVVIVEQEPHLFPMTLMENVLYGIEQASENIFIDSTEMSREYNHTIRTRVSEALELAGLPVGARENNDLGLTLDTRVGEGGRTLSGGQRQRVAIARALVRQPDVLLLDEPTAALDSKSEMTVVKALKQAMDRTRCMLMVTHRFSPIRSLGVNKVVVLDRGKIVEIGHPEELLQKNGLFAQMAREQGIYAAIGGDNNSLYESDESNEQEQVHNA